MALALGWVAFAFVLQKALSYESPVTFYDPYKILGISSVRTIRLERLHRSGPLTDVTIHDLTGRDRTRNQEVLQKAELEVVSLTRSYEYC